MTTYLPYYKRNLTLALPLILSQIGQALVQQVDIMMIGNVGTVELAAVAFANSIFIIGLIVSMGFALGLTPAIGHVFAEKDSIVISRLISNSFLLNLIFTILIAFLLVIASLFFNKMGQNEVVVALSKPYYYLLILSIFPLMIFMTFKQFTEGVGNTKNAMYVTVLGNLVNIVLNYLLIYGKFGAPQLGIIGAGIATLISRVVMAISFLLIVYRKPYFSIYMHKISLNYINKVYLKKLFVLGAPISMQMLLEVLAFGLSAIMAGWVSVTALASHQIALSLASFTFMIAVGIGSATTIRVAHQFSDRDFGGLLMAAKASIHIVLTFMGISALTFIIFRNAIPHFYSNDPEVIRFTSSLLIIAAIFQLFDGLQVVMLSILRGLGDVNHAMKYAFIAYILINLPIGYLLGFVFNFGIIGIWIAFVIGLGVASIMFMMRFRVLYLHLKTTISNDK
jgi:MATE family multidrug resistance protein